MRFSTLAILATAFVSLMLTAAPAQSDNAYRWKDASGRVFYGSRPPKSARSAARVETPRLSRYSSDKVLRRLGKDVNKQSRARLSGGGSANSSSSSDDALDSFEAAKLSHDKVLISRNEDQAIISCSVAVKNDGATDASDVSVAFEFSDGSLVPAVGPLEIPAGEEAVFGVPEELMPLKSRLSEDQIDKILADPRIVLHGLASTKQQ